MSKEKDLEFLKEMKETLNYGIKTRDFRKIEFVIKMIDEWIDELGED